jgi:predicted ArsR family transcriptional regulator
VGLEQDVELLGVLVEPQRRRIYEELARAAEPLTLSELAKALELGRTLMSFHLGKLVDAGFVEVLPAQSSAGRRGRPSQRYRVSAREVMASVPARHYDVVARVLLEAATDRHEGESVEAAARRVARAQGADEARAERSRRGVPMRVLERLLARLGYSPAREDGALVLRNCPFDKLRDTNRELVCGINHALAEGYVDGIGAADDLTAVLRPCPDNCCVVVRPRP